MTTRLNIPKMREKEFWTDMMDGKGLRRIESGCWKVIVTVLLVALSAAYFSPTVAETISPTHFGLLEAWVDLQAVEELGIQWVRAHLDWGVVQPNREGGLRGRYSTTIFVINNAMVSKPW